MSKTKRTYLAVLALLLSPIAANADIIRLGGSIDNGASVFTDFMIIGVDRNKNGILGPREIRRVRGLMGAFGESGIGDVIFRRIRGLRIDLATLLTVNRRPINAVGRCVRGTGVDCVRGARRVVVGLDPDLFVWTRKDAAIVPEPGTLALLGIGLLGIGIARRRRTV